MTKYVIILVVGFCLGWASGVRAEDTMQGGGMTQDLKESLCPTKDPNCVKSLNPPPPKKPITWEGIRAFKKKMDAYWGEFFKSLEKDPEVKEYLEREARCPKVMCPVNDWQCHEKQRYECQQLEYLRRK